MRHKGDLQRPVPVLRSFRPARAGTDAGRGVEETSGERLSYSGFRIPYGWFRRTSQLTLRGVFRAPNLLSDVYEAAPETKFLIVVRPPLGYIRSAHSRGVLQRGDGWDLFRLMPQHSAELPLAVRIAMHWQTINEYLLDFAEQHGCPVIIHQDWAQLIDRLPEWLGVGISDPRALVEYWATKPNMSIGTELPDGFDEPIIARITEPTMARAQRLSTSSI